MSDIPTLTLASSVSHGDVAQAMGHRIKQSLEAEYEAARAAYNTAANRFNRTTEDICDALMGHEPSWVEALIDSTDEALDVIVTCTPDGQFQPSRWFAIEVSRSSLMGARKPKTHACHFSGKVDVPWVVDVQTLEAAGVLDKVNLLSALLVERDEKRKAFRHANDRYLKRDSIAQDAAREFLAQLIENHMPEVASIMEGAKALTLMDKAGEK